MNTFEDLIDFLQVKGVKSLHIELVPRELTETQEREIEKSARLMTMRSVTVAAEQPKAESPESSVIAKLIDQPAVTQVVTGIVPVAEEPKAAKPLPVEEPKADEPAAPVVEEPKAAKPLPVEEPKKSRAKKEAAPKAEKAAAATTPASVPQEKMYEAFCELISSDTGSVTPEQRRALIDKMGLDDLLRVNNDFQLGIDTDRPVEAVREEVRGCF